MAPIARAIDELLIYHLEKRRIAGHSTKIGQIFAFKKFRKIGCLRFYPVCICTSTLNLTRQLLISNLLFSFDILESNFYRRIYQIQNESAANG